MNFLGKSEVCSCAEGVCPKCGRTFKEWDSSWDDAMNEHARMEAEFLVDSNAQEGGFIGLQVSEQPPHNVRSVDDLVCVRAAHAGTFVWGRVLSVRMRACEPSF